MGGIVFLPLLLIVVVQRIGTGNGGSAVKQKTRFQGQAATGRAESCFFLGHGAVPSTCKKCTTIVGAIVLTN